jgi:TrpR family trp operon transcriptional repressor
MNTHINQQLLNLLCDITDVDEMRAAIEMILTDNEQQEVDKRLKIFNALEDKVAQREISAQLGVGIATVTRGSKAMQTDSYLRLKDKLARSLKEKG